MPEIMRDLVTFRERFKVLRQKWGYRYEADPNYEEMTVGDLRQFQHLTDYLMRFLAQGFVTDTDVKTMIGVDFYIPPRDGELVNPFSVPSEVLKKYLTDCGPFFMEYTKTCMDAKKYLRRCPASMEKCLLMVALSWTSVVRKHVRKLNNEQDISIRKFTKKIKKAALDECRTYLGSLRADNIKDAFIEVKEAEEIRRLRRVLQAARRAARARTAPLQLRF